jgi:uncharacterized damage-inducible protein DinB
MAIRDALLPEFDHEMASTRRVLERVPDDAVDWRPHPKSMTLGRLASHLAEMPHWGTVALTQDSFDVTAPGGARDFTPPPSGTRAEMLAAFDKNVAEARAAITAADDDSFRQSWSLKKGGQPIFTMPRAVVMRSFLLNHLIHHRGQLTVYLRMRDVPLPSLYGPTADERQ